MIYYITIFYSRLFNLKKIFIIEPYIHIDRYNNPTDLLTNKTHKLPSFEITTNNKENAIQIGINNLNSYYPQFHNKLHFNISKK